MKNCGRCTPIFYGRVKTREGDGYIYVVIEHQSREDIRYGLSADAIFHGGDAASYRA